MAVTHVILAQFRADASAEAVKKACASILSLKNECVHPATQRPYLLSVSGGTDNSPMGMQDGMTHAFVIEFESIEDRDYFNVEDPAHKAFGQLVQGAVEKVIIVDYIAGVFESKN